MLHGPRPEYCQKNWIYVGVVSWAFRVLVLDDNHLTGIGTLMTAVFEIFTKLMCKLQLGRVPFKTILMRYKL